MKKKNFVFTILYILLSVTSLFSQEPVFEKFISSSVTVGNKVYPFYIVYENGKPVEIFVETEDWCEKIYGYGGPINLQIYFTLDGKIKNIKVLEQYETESYAKEVFSDRFLSQFYGKNSSSKFSLGKDVKAITGATISCTAVTEIIYQCVQNVNKHLFGKIVLHHELCRISKDEIVKTTIFVGISLIATLAYLFNLTKIVRYVILLITIIFLGVNYNGGFSFGHIQSFIKLNLPPFGNLFLWVLLFTIVVTAVLFGRLYCGWLCPFGAVIELLFDIKKFLETKYKKVLGEKIEFEVIEDNFIVKMLRKYEHYFRYIKYVIAVIIFFFPAFIAIEPFQHTFVFYKTKFWYIVYVVIILVLCIIFVRLWCRYFCPLGAIIALISNLSLFRLKIDSENCLMCEICVNNCPTNAIVENNRKLKLLHTECILCNKCIQVCGPKCISQKFIIRK